MSLAIKQARFASQGGMSGNVQAGGFLDVLKGIGRGVAGFIRGGPGGAIRGALNGGRDRPTLQPRGFDQQVPSPTQRRIQAALPFGKTGFEGLKLACPSGHHPNKSGYFLIDGSFIEKGSRCVKNRRRNPMNPRALDRAISRVDSGKSLQGKLATITTAKWTAGGQRKAHTHG